MYHFQLHIKKKGASVCQQNSPNGTVSPNPFGSTQILRKLKLLKMRWSYQVFGHEYGRKDLVQQIPLKDPPNPHASSGKCLKFLHWRWRMNKLCKSSYLGILIHHLSHSYFSADMSDLVILHFQNLRTHQQYLEISRGFSIRNPDNNRFLLNFVIPNAKIKKPNAKFSLAEIMDWFALIYLPGTIIPSLAPIDNRETEIDIKSSKTQNPIIHQ